MSPTPTPPPPPLYIPLVRKDPCPKRYQHVDVVLVVDTSDSMLAPVGDGRTKLDAARGAARAFVRLLDLTRDAAAIVFFHTDADVLQPLTRDRTALESALDRLPQHPGTRIDRGLAAAAVAMGGPGRHAENLPVVIVLTDGRPSGVSGADVLRAADRLKSAGIVLYVIGLGADVDPVLLSEMASDKASYFFAPDAEALRTIYTRIARELPCRRP
jgi:Mg-chelatase subunit ChlD